MSTALRRLAGATCVLAMATAACGDPAPDPSVAPIEVVANTLAATAESACALNRTVIGAGTHEFVAIAESQPAVVQLQNSRGVTIFEERVEQGASTSTTVTLEAGLYFVSCAHDGGTPVTSTGLRVEGD